MSVKLLTRQHLEFLSLAGGCRSSSESTLAKMPHCWKSHVAAHIYSAVTDTRDIVISAFIGKNQCSGIHFQRFFYP